MGSYEDLQTKCSAFNTFNETTARLAHGLTEDEEDKLGFADVAKRIADPTIRRKYCELAAAMLQANINHYRFDATVQTAPAGSPSWIVTSTLIASAIAYYLKVRLRL